MVLLGMVWFINLVNFMDGIDWMSVAEIVPLTAGLTIFGLMGELPRDATAVAAGLLGAVLGFAPFNRPVARLFLGDVGSLPIGLLLAWMLILLAARDHLAAAILLPLYYLADAKQSRCCTGSYAGRRLRRRIATISISAPWMADTAFIGSLARFFRSISFLCCWRSSQFSIRPPPIK